MTATRRLKKPYVLNLAAQTMLTLMTSTTDKSLTRPKIQRNSSLCSSPLTIILLNVWSAL